MQYKMEHTIFIHIRQSYSYSTKNEVPSMDNIKIMYFSRDHSHIKDEFLNSNCILSCPM